MNAFFDAPQAAFCGRRPGWDIVAGMSRSTRRAGTVRSLRVILAVACVLLVMLTGTVQVVHSHAGGDDSHASCSLCVTAHVAVHLTQAQAPTPAARVVARIETRPPAELPSGSTAFSHFSRPPPSLNLPA